MKTLLIVMFAGTLVLCACSAFPAAQAAKPMVLGGGMVVDSMSATAKVVSVDPAKHSVALQMPDGRVRTFKVHKEVKCSRKVTGSTPRSSTP